MRKLFLICLLTFIFPLTANAKTYEEELNELLEDYPTDEQVVEVDRSNHIITIDDQSQSFSDYGLVDNKKNIDKTLKEDGYILEWDGKEASGVNRFSTMRLIVKDNIPENDYAAVKVVRKNEEYAVYQYESIEDTMSAYNLMLEDGIEVIPDEIVKCNLSALNGEIMNGIMGLKEAQTNPFFTKKEVVVAVFDTGLNAQYFDLKRIVGQKTFIGSNEDVFGHGTEVASVILDSTADNVKIMPLKVISDSGNATVLDIENAFTYALENGADIINMSIGIKDDENEPYWTDWNDSIDKAVSMNIPVIVAAGNDTTTVKGNYPANYGPVWTISAVDADKKIADYSNYDCIDFCAYGNNISTIGMDGVKKINKGTSLATPLIASIVANIKGSGDYKIGEIYDYLKYLSEDLGEEGYDKYYGYGLPTLKMCEHTNNVVLEERKATCKEDGYKKTKCSICGLVRDETIKASPEYHNMTTEENAPDCENAGYHKEYCTICGHIAVNDDIPATGHDVKSEITEATCTKAGTERKICKKCGKIVSEVAIPIKEHTLITIHKDPTTAEKGYDIVKCEICGTVITEKYIDKLPTQTAIISKKKTVISSVVAKKRKITVKVKKLDKAKKYRIEIATNKGFTKGHKTKLIKGTSYTFTKLKAKKKYYIRVRALYQNGYGSFSKTKAIKTK